jgi:hypothetical protein
LVLPVLVDLISRRRSDQDAPVESVAGKRRSAELGDI